MELFTGAPAQLCEHLKKEFKNNKAFTLEQIRFTPTDDTVVLSVTTDDFSLSFSNKESEQLTGHKIFDNSYMYGFQNTFYKGLLYQLTFIAVYKDGGNVKTFTPTLPCDRATWNTYWASNMPDKNCIVYAAVNLLEGESIHKKTTLEIQGGAVKYYDIVINISDYKDKVDGDLFCMDLNDDIGYSRVESALSIQLYTHDSTERDIVHLFTNIPFEYKDNGVFLVPNAVVYDVSLGFDFGYETVVELDLSDIVYTDTGGIEYQFITPNDTDGYLRAVSYLNAEHLSEGVISEMFEIEELINESAIFIKIRCSVFDTETLSAAVNENV